MATDNECTKHNQHATGRRSRTTFMKNLKIRPFEMILVEFSQEFHGYLHL